jgi:hypothetical protein
MLVVVNDLTALRDEPPPVHLTLGDGTWLIARAAGLALHLVWGEERWEPMALYGVRVRSVLWSGRELFASDRLRAGIDLTLR